MTKNRFKIIDEEFISYYGGNGCLISNGNCKFWLWHDKSGSQKVCDKLNIIMEENEQLKQQINDIRFDWSRDYRELHKDTLYIEDHNTKIKLKDGRLYIDVFVPELGEYFRFDYIVTGIKLEKEYNKR